MKAIENLLISYVKAAAYMPANYANLSSAVEPHVALSKPLIECLMFKHFADSPDDQIVQECNEILSACKHKNPMWLFFFCKLAGIPMASESGAFIIAIFYRSRKFSLLNANKALNK